jgi:multiple sugar transport system permease protein
MKRLNRNDLRRLAIGLAFLLPNLTGFLVFTLFPLVVSFSMAFTNWDLTLHNMFKTESVHFAGLTNFGRLFSHPDFWQFVGNTFFLMLGIPFSMAASLGAALLLSKKFPTGRRTVGPMLIAAIPAAGCFGVLGLTGALEPGLAWVMAGVMFFLALGGGLGGTTFYRTLYFLPNFTASVATFLLWKKMYDPQSGPVNAALQPILNGISHSVVAVPSPLISAAQWAFFAGATALVISAMQKARRAWIDESECCGPRKPRQWQAAGWRLLLGIILAYCTVKIGQCLPGFAENCKRGLEAPNWLTDYYWAKPAIMIMSFWISAGSINMLLYIAGLTSIPRELYEAADIDGASPSQRFWAVTWPQLAPITFFIAIMSIIGGLQGGFEMAKTMTNGGPAGATTTISFFIFSEGFETGRLALASAIAWTLFVFVFVVTLFNWRVGSRMTNE